VTDTTPRRTDPRSTAIGIVIALVALMWVLEVVDVALDHRLDRYGIEPRDPDGLDGVVAAPFLHVGFGGAVRRIDERIGRVEVGFDGDRAKMQDRVAVAREIIDGLPPGTTLKLKPKINTVSPAMIVPGTIGGPGYRAGVQITLDCTGTGNLAGYQRTLVITNMLECHVGQITPGPVQSLDNML